MDAPKSVEDILEHFGTKGMKWGVRKRITGSSAFKSWSKVSEANVQRHHARRSARAQKRVAKQERRFDKTFANKGRTNQLKVELHNNIGPVVQSKVNRLNTSSKYAKAISSGRLKDANDPITKQYINDFNKLYMNEMNSYLKGYQSPMGKTVKAELNSQDFLGFSLKVQNARGATKVKHADKDDMLMRVNYIKAKDGRIIDTEVADDELVQSAIDDILVHHGVKGMRWGVRKAASSRVQGVKAARARAKSPEVTITDKRKKIKTTGGRGHPAHPDAVRARTSGQIAAKSGLKALSNQQLREFNERLNLEANASRLTDNERSSGRKFVRKMIGRKDVQSGAKNVGMGLAMQSSTVRRKVAKGAAALAFAGI